MKLTYFALLKSALCHIHIRPARIKMPRSLAPGHTYRLERLFTVFRYLSFSAQALLAAVERQHDRALGVPLAAEPGALDPDLVHAIRIAPLMHLLRDAIQKFRIDVKERPPEDKASGAKNGDDIADRKRHHLGRIFQHIFKQRDPLPRVFDNVLDGKRLNVVLHRAVPVPKCL